MKNCPNCNELLGNNAEKCFKCRYSFKMKRVLDREEEKVREQKIEEKRIQEKIEFERVQNEYQSNREKNALYEYDVVVLYDKNTGEFDVERYKDILKTYSAAGWMLKSVFSNELGKNSTAIGYMGISGGTNATIDQTIITFERCIRPSKVE